MKKIPAKIQYLSLAGILPILIGVIGSFDLYFIDDVVNLWLIKFSILFSALILSFLGGCLFIFEIQLATKALDTHIEDLEEIKLFQSK